MGCPRFFLILFSVQIKLRIFGEMFEGDFSDTCVEKCPPVTMTIKSKPKGLTYTIGSTLTKTVMVAKEKRT
jgi:hypothetical protein